MSRGRFGVPKLEASTFARFDHELNAQTPGPGFDLGWLPAWLRRSEDAYASRRQVFRKASRPRNASERGAGSHSALQALVGEWRCHQVLEAFKRLAVNFLGPALRAIDQV
jgi:hypothetical protein